MGRCDTAAVSLGLRVGLQALLDQTTDANFQQVAEILRSGRSFIEDENDYYDSCWIRFLPSSKGSTVKARPRIRPPLSIV
jgi:hypothetical protein